MARKASLTIERREKFLDLLNEGTSQTRAARELGLNYQRLKRIAKEDDKFREEWEEAQRNFLEEKYDQALEELWDAAINGWDEVRTEGGEEKFTIHRHDKGLLLKLLSMVNREKLAGVEATQHEKHEVDHSFKLEIRSKESKEVLSIVKAAIGSGVVEDE